MKKYLAIDIGGTFIKYGVYKRNGDAIISGKRATPKNYEVFLNILLEIIKESESIEEFVAIAISCPGFINTKTGENTDFSVGDNIKTYNLKKKIEEKTKYKVSIENDAKCAALAEKWLGSGKNCENFCVVTLGTGIGGGVIINNKLYKGNNSKAGEFGLSYININGYEKEITKKRPPSAQELVRTVSAALNKEVDGEYIFNNLDNKLIKRIYDNWLLDVAMLLINISIYFDPEKILIGGGISQTKNLIRDLNEKINSIDSYVLNYTKIEPCFFRNNSGKIGAIYNYILNYESNKNI